MLLLRGIISERNRSANWRTLSFKRSGCDDIKKELPLSFYAIGLNSWFQANSPQLQPPFGPRLAGRPLINQLQISDLRRRGELQFARTAGRRAHAGDAPLDSARRRDPGAGGVPPQPVAPALFEQQGLAEQLAGFRLAAVEVDAMHQARLIDVGVRDAGGRAQPPVETVPVRAGLEVAADLRVQTERDARSGVERIQLRRAFPQRPRIAAVVFDLQGAEHQVLGVV